ncbi:MAG: ankyrin repeat domain-containing protein [Elusimicrobiota bacterium]
MLITYESLLNNDIEAVRSEIDAGAEVNARTQDRNETALMVAACYNYVRMAELLIESGADVNLCDIDGITPLVFAAHNNSFEVARLLLENGVDVNTKEKNGATALMIAVSRNHSDIACLIREYGGE